MDNPSLPHPGGERQPLLIRTQFWGQFIVVSWLSFGHLVVQCRHPLPPPPYVAPTWANGRLVCLRCTTVEEWRSPTCRLPFG